jgi:hypothetical protein
MHNDNNVIGCTIFLALQSSSGSSLATSKLYSFVSLLASKRDSLAILFDSNFSSKQLFLECQYFSPLSSLSSPLSPDRLHPI